MTNSLKLSLDPELCQGHARCFALAPEVFRLDAQGHGEVRSESVPEALQAKALRAVRACPERAIKTTGGDGA
ncbi:MAG: hypothetical protein JWO83_1556 [Caulobacteraceae bacterium]|nr:hypothetical protein [Caulobacteraceae bacterium]